MIPFHPDAVAYEPQSFLVYGVYRDSNLIYIGSGTAQRATDSLRQKYGDELMVVKCDSREAAYVLEAKLILKHLPPKNWTVPKPNGTMAKLLRPFHTKEQLQIMRERREIENANRIQRWDNQRRKKKERARKLRKAKKINDALLKQAGML
jgi:hypothetical protein